MSNAEGYRNRARVARRLITRCSMKIAIVTRGCIEVHRYYQRTRRNCRCLLTVAWRRGAEPAGSLLVFCGGQVIRKAKTHHPGQNKTCTGQSRTFCHTA